MSTEDQRAIADHQTWLGYLQPEGLVVSPAALHAAGVNYDRNIRPEHRRFLEHLAEHQGWDAQGGDSPELTDLPAFLTHYLGWNQDDLVPADQLPDELSSVLPEYRETISPTFGVKNPHPSDDPDAPIADQYLLLIQQTPEPGLDLDAPFRIHERGWDASPSRRFERLLRDSKVPIGLLSNGQQLRLHYAPSGENPGSLTFPIASMAEISGRPMLGGLHLLLEEWRIFIAGDKESLAGLLHKSREFQANVSTALAAQVLDGLYELLRGLGAADSKTGVDLLRDVLQQSPQQIYEGLLNVLMRLVFLLFAEDRDLMPASQLYGGNYSVHGLFEKLKADAESHPDTMDTRYGAWAQLLALFRLIHDGSRHADLKMPARYGYLFDPDRFPFLEGRQPGSTKGNTTLPIPLIPDGTIHTVLQKLLVLKGERLSYRTLDVEQIGSVYETMMGFQLQVATGPTIAIKPAKMQGAPPLLELDELLAVEPTKVTAWIKEKTDRKLAAGKLKQLKAASTHEEILAVLEGTTARSSLIARNATPQIVPKGALLLQPSEARRKSGSHYTPRKLTEPIVRKALEPILANLGEKPFPKQILDLKVCDPAVGSGAFLVEACRQLGEELVRAWAAHRGKPKLFGEDESLHARRLVAQRCLYGVDRNPMAADLAKLSLWLATLAKDQPFTFLAHAIKSGDSLVGLSKKQILAFHWDLKHKSAKQRVFGQDQLEKKIKSALAYRQEILDAGDLVLPEMKAPQLRLAEEEVDKVRRAGDLAVLGFFSGSKQKERQEARDRLLERWLKATDQSGSEESLREGVALKSEVHQIREAEHSVTPFHWEIEFPEVFERKPSGFDAFVGNPPFLGGRRTSASLGQGFSNWINTVYDNSSNNADLVAFFFRRAFSLLRQHGALGLIATNTIAQGDTRETGLRWIRANNGVIYQARRRMRWPGMAAVVVSVIHATKGDTEIALTLDGKVVDEITAFLFHRGTDESPKLLMANCNRSFQGVIPLGAGFLFQDDATDRGASTQQERLRLVEADPRNSEMIKPYIGGHDILDNPRHETEKFVIDFESMSLTEAGRWPDLVTILEEKVKPERAKQKRKHLRERWWQFAEVRPAMRSALTDREHTLVHPFTSTYLAFAFIPTSTLVAGPHQVIAFEELSAFCVLQSRAHDFWSRFFASSMKDDLRYTPSDCFDNFPFPQNWESDTHLEEIGCEYYDYRAELMVRNDEGMTKTYNRFHDPGETSPDIHKLRELHAAMDRAVLDAYGDDWKSIPTDCEFIPDFTEEDDDGNEIPKNIRYRWPNEVRDDVLARLIALNAERAEQEKLEGKSAKKVTKRASKKSARPAIVEVDATTVANAPSKQVPLTQHIPTFSFDLPADSRPAAGGALGFYRAWLAAALREAGGRLAWNECKAAAIALLSPDAVTIDGTSDSAKRRWIKSLPDSRDPGQFHAALESFAVDSHLIRIVEVADGFELRATQELLDKPEIPWATADAQFSLAGSLSVDLVSDGDAATVESIIPLETLRAWQQNQASA